MIPLQYMPVFFGVSIEVYFILLIVGAPTFFIWRWIFKKFIKLDKSRKIATWTATIVATPLIYVGLITLFLFNAIYHPSHAFNKEIWTTNKEIRYEFSENIIKSEMLIGKTKAEVRKILGDEHNLDQSNHWSYDLGYKPETANIDPEVLVIEFKGGKVIRVEQRKT